MLLNSSNIISSKGLLRCPYNLKDTEYCSNELDIINILKKNTNIIFIRTGSFQDVNDLYYFANNLNLLIKPIILITSDGDRPVPSSYNKETVLKILNHKFILFWHTQNYDKTLLHPKFKFFPIGIDLYTHNRLINNNIDDKLIFMNNLRNKSPSNKRFLNKILSDTHFSYSHIERKQLYNLIKDNNMIDLTKERLSFIEIAKIYSKYNFVLSPRGRGIDCYRTWELFLLGCIVITKTSSLDNMYLKNNLPVVILDNYNELNDNLEKN